MRIAVIGARRQRQGTGAFLARFCAAAGADVVALLGTQAETVAQAVADFEKAAGSAVRGFTDVEALLAETSPEGLVIAGPPATHTLYLRRALEAGLHVLCEKPLVWGASDPAGEAEELARAYVAAGLHLRVNAQWPLTLPGYETLYPGAAEAPHRFHMLMSPQSKGPAMLLDCLPHPLSLLAAVLPDAAAHVEGIRVDGAAPHAEEAEVHFTYRAAGAAVACHVQLRHCPSQPRPAAYGFDDRIAARAVQLDPYGFGLYGGERRIPLPDPVPLLVGSFLADVGAGAKPVIDAAAIPGMRHLVRIVEASPGAFEYLSDPEA